MTAAEFAAALGGAHRSGGWWRCICPVHGSRTGRSATLALRDGELGLIAVCHAGCDRRDVMAALRRLRLPGGSDGGRREPMIGTGSGHHGAGDATRRTAAARSIWDAATEARGSPVAAYLARRGITIVSPASLRWAPSLRHPDATNAPAMVGRIDDIDGKFIGVQRTWLCRDAAGQWRRRDRAMLGRAAGGAVRLAPTAETLLIAEGIETALAGMAATGMPAWAALSTSGLVALALPLIVRHVVILADHDVSGAGERAARAAAQRWLVEGRQVRIAMPLQPGTDVADMLTGRGHARIPEVSDVAA